jgi:transcriptional regulator with GAF, ATPase, and Fis domain
MDITLRQGEGISGAAALSRQPVFAVNAQRQRLHDSRIDERFGLRTYAMVSAPILFEDHLSGVITILNHYSDKVFSPEWKEWLCALAVMYAAALAKVGKLIPYQALSNMGMQKKSPKVTQEQTVIVGISQAVQEAFHLCLKAGETDIPVLIYGETGTGKELAARRIHEAGARAEGPFLEVNCAALSETLLESELFGHVKGAFTGATKDRLGKFMAASGGTLFLDEIGEMTVACQAKILRVLEEKKVTPLGSEKSVPSDTRIIAATNKNLLEMMSEKKFREDLYYRLCGIEIMIPPLRERAEDIHLLALYFINKVHAQQKRDPPRERPVRQLEQAIFAAAALCEGDEITPANLPAWLHKALTLGLREHEHAPSTSESHHPESEPVPEKEHRLLKNEERTRYLEALNATRYPGTGRWNVSAAARQLGIPRETLAYHLKKFRLFR